MSTGPGPPPITSEVRDGVSSEVQDENSRASYSQALTSQVQTRWETFYLQKIDPSANYGLSNEEIAKFIFEELEVPPGKLVSYDDSNFQRLDIEVYDDVSGGLFNTTSAITIKPGLRVKPRIHINEPQATYVRCYWTSVRCPDEKFVEALEPFGTVMEISHMKFKAKPYASALEKKLNNVKKGDRIIKMHIKKKIPSYGIIDDKKVKFIYDGQTRTCPRCHEPHSNCPGYGNPGECERMKGPKIAVEEAWENAKHKEEVAYHGESLNIEFDYVELFGVDAGQTSDDITAKLEEEGFKLMPGEEIVETKYPNTRTVIGLTVSRMKELMLLDRKVNGEKGTWKLAPIIDTSPSKKRTKGKTSRAQLDISNDQDEESVSDEGVLDLTVVGHPDTLNNKSKQNDAGNDRQLSDPKESTRLLENNNDDVSNPNVSIIPKNEDIEDHKETEESDEESTATESEVEEVPQVPALKLKRKVTDANLSSPDSIYEVSQATSKKERKRLKKLKQKENKQKNLLNDISSLHSSDFVDSSPMLKNARPSRSRK